MAGPKGPACAQGLWRGGFSPRGYLKNFFETARSFTAAARVLVVRSFAVDPGISYSKCSEIGPANFASPRVRPSQAQSTAPSPIGQFWITQPLAVFAQ